MTPTAWVLALLATCTAAHAHSPALDCASLWFGGYFVDTTVDVQARSDFGRGDVEFAGGNETLERARLDVLVGRRHGFTLDHFGFGHSDAQALQRSYTFDDVVFDVSGDLRSHVDFRAGSAAWHWWFGQEDNLFGLGLGAARYRLLLQLDGVASVNGELVSASARLEESATAPLLTLGYRHAFTPDARLYVTTAGVRKGGGSISGTVVDARVGFEWFPWQHVGFGAEYGATRIRLIKDHALFRADLDLTLHGPSLFARLRF